MKDRKAIFLTKVGMKDSSIIFGVSKEELLFLKGKKVLIKKL